MDEFRIIQAIVPETSPVGGKLKGVRYEARGLWSDWTRDVISDREFKARAKEILDKYSYLEVRKAIEKSGHASASITSNLI